MKKKSYLLSKIRENVENFIKKDISGFEVRSKEDSWMMKIAGKLMFFNKSFMTHYITTSYPYIYVPKLPWKKEGHLSAVTVLAHEWVHLHDRKRMGLLFNFLYAAPQILAPFALFAFVNPWFLLFLLFFLPIPSPGRAWAEFRGYRMTIAAYYWLSGTKINIKWVVDQFTTSNYYFMWPFQGWLIKKFNKEFEKIEKGELSPELKIMHDVIKNKRQ